MITGGENSEQRQIQSQSFFRRALPWVATGTAGLASATLATTDLAITPGMVAGVTGISAAEVTAGLAFGYGAYRAGRGLFNRAKDMFRPSAKKRKRNSEQYPEEEDTIEAIAPSRKVKATEANAVQPPVGVPQEIAPPLVDVLEKDKSDKETYEEHLLATIAHIAEIKRELNRCKTLFRALDNIEALALNANFSDEGALTADQPGRNKLQFLRWEEKVLEQLLQTPGKEQAAYKREIAKKSEVKLEKASSKPMI